MILLQVMVPLIIPHMGAYAHHVPTKPAFESPWAGGYSKQKVRSIGMVCDLATETHGMAVYECDPNLSVPPCVYTD